MITLPVHYGSTGQPWPGGFVWLIEFQSRFGISYYWTDDYDFAGRTGWALSACHAAGFASKLDALSAFQQRGVPLYEDSKIRAIEHHWDEPKKPTYRIIN